MRTPLCWAPPEELAGFVCVPRLSNHPVGTEVADQSLIEVCFSAVVPRNINVDRRPDVEAGASRVLMDLADNSVMGFVIKPEPRDEQPNNFVAADASAGCVCHDIRDVLFLLLRFRFVPHPKRLAN